ncbi:MAG: phospho-sugar mutase [Akkermansiaceae bacterium]
MSDLQNSINKAVASGQLLESSQQNISALMAGTTSPIAELAITELVHQEAWQELNDRFFKTLAFGTGGLRGRTIGKVVTSAEQGAGGPNDRPEHPCVGTASMNYYNVGRAVRGMITYFKRFIKESGSDRKPSFVFGHDTRHFSRDYAEFCAKLCTELGCDVHLFDAPRATPEISYAIRKLNADAGVVLTASHNPSHDNGFKAYGSDGGQLVEPQASGVINEVNAITSEAYDCVPESERGTLHVLADMMDKVYMDDAKSLLLRPDLLQGSSTKVVFTNLHGTGGHCIVPLLNDLGFEVLTVAEQDVQDGRFPTVASPNPENAPALAMAIELAEREGAEIVIGTDPDCDRMGVAVRNDAGKMQLLTGNQIGSLMAWYRTKTFFEQGVINDSNRSRAVLIKTFVTTELQTAIAEKFGVGIVDTLTGFKYIAAKLQKYEDSIPADKKGDYRSLSPEASRALRLEYSRFFIFGGEESYGYLGTDSIRDKDGNGAAVMFAELAAFAKSEGKSLAALLDELYTEFGYHLEMGKAIVMEGADGAANIKALAASYSVNPPSEIDGAAVTRIRDFSKDDIEDVEGDTLPKEGMLILDLADGRSCAVRPSGTEPKIKYYLFGKDAPSASDLQASKDKVTAGLESMWLALESDAKARMA